ncbi:alpha/beta hydrolase [Cohnella faecalis]|uniref:Esterase family protein n=1 Tax=Cohnella faecalis TaxID=2315694 RepID=A0A398CIB7_9BACL|nr:alpha/beta hydrolase-fold protein [Cohnella faecalis]RIE01782.1 esterase family protein [Cohnella faecalis]
MKIVQLSAIVGIWSAVFLNGCTDETSTSAPLPSSSSISSASPSSVSADSGSRIEQVDFHSAALDSEMSLSVYLPPAYSPAVEYPVLYLLYGYGGTHDSWFTYLRINEASDRLIQENRIDPVIIVSPDYGNSFGVNTKAGESKDPGGVSIGPYEDYLIQDVVSYVDSHYSTRTSRDGRYIGGASMGGYASLFLGLTHPDLFSKIGAHSAAIWNYTSTDQFTDQRDWLYANEALRDERDPFKLAESGKLSGTRIYLDAGEADALAEKDRSLYERLNDLNVDAQWVSNPGGHDAAYWSGQLESYLLFYAGKE